MGTATVPTTTFGIESGVRSIPSAPSRGSRRAAAEALMAAVHARDAGTGTHCAGVVRFGLDVLGVLDPVLAEDPMVGYGYLMHDVGKLSVPDAVLLKPGPLNATETRLMRQHPLWGVQIVQRVPCFRDTETVRIVRHHHERWDGFGYPDGLAGAEISLACRVLTVVDAFDAMTSQRPYRAALPVERAVAEVRKGRGTQFAPDAVDALLDRIAA